MLIPQQSMENHPSNTSLEVVHKFLTCINTEKFDEAPLHPKFQFWAFSDPTIPTGGYYEGFFGLKAYFTEKQPSTFKIATSTPKRFLCDGANVFVLGHLDAEAIWKTHPFCGKKVEVYYVMHFVIEEMKIRVLREYTSSHLAGAIPDAFDFDLWETNRQVLLSLYDKPKDLPSHLHDDVKLWCYGSYGSKLNAHLKGKTEVLQYYATLHEIYDISNRTLHEIQSFNNEVTISGMCEAKFKQEGDILKGKTLDFYFINKAFFRDGKVDKIRIIWGLSELNEFPMFVGVEDAKERLVKFTKLFYETLANKSPEAVAVDLCSESIKTYVLGPGEFSVNGAYFGHKQFVKFLNITRTEFKVSTSKDVEYHVSGDNTVIVSGVSHGRVIREGHVDHDKEYTNNWVHIFIVQDSKIFTFISKWTLEPIGATPYLFEKKSV